MSPRRLSSFLLAITISLTLSITPALSTFNALVAPITKDTSTSLFSLTFNTTSHTAESFVLDISTHLPWLKNCQPKHEFPRVPCSSTACSDSKLYDPSLCQHGRTSNISNINIICGGRGNCRCRGIAVNPVSNQCAASHLITTKFFLSSTDGQNPLADASVGPVYMGCAPKMLLGSLPSDTSGLLSFSRAPLSVPSQLAPGLAKQFAICLPSGGEAAPGVAFMGTGPFFMKAPDQPGMNMNDRLEYSLLAQKPGANNSFDYYVEIFEITVILQRVDFSFEATPEFDSSAAKLSTVVPYTTMRTPLYKAFLEAFDRETSAIPRASGPFDFCLNTTKLHQTPVGLSVPPVELRLKRGGTWNMLGANLFKQVSKDVACLAFVDGGENAHDLMVIGSFQMENNFLLFDLEENRLGFTGLLALFGTNCSNFNTTSGI